LKLSRLPLDLVRRGLRE